MTRLKKARLKAGLKQIELASMIGIMQPSMSRAEKNGLKSIKAAKRYAKVLNCAPIDILEI